MQRAAHKLQAPTQASPTDLPEPPGEPARMLRVTVAVVGMRPLARTVPDRAYAAIWPAKAPVYYIYVSGRMVVAPRVGALALVLQSREDEGFLYARQTPLAVRAG
jgi:hypothetical protein